MQIIFKSIIVSYPAVSIKIDQWYEQTWYLSLISLILLTEKKIVMWRNFSFPCMTIVGKLKISPHVEKFQYNWWGFIAIYAVLLLNLLFTLFCREIFATIYALSCGEKLSPKVNLWRKKMKNMGSAYQRKKFQAKVVVGFYKKKLELVWIWV